MTGKTHIAIGVAAALQIIQPKTAPEICLCVTAAAVGASVPDIDVSSSTSRKSYERLSFVGVLMLSGLVVFNQLDGVMEFVKGNPDMLKSCISALLAVIICGFGMRKPHRTFMHSIPCAIVLSVLAGRILESAVWPFVIGITLHIAVDLLNMKGVQLAYPLKKKYCLKLCSASGMVNDTLMAISTLIILMWVCTYKP